PGAMSATAAAGGLRLRPCTSTAWASLTRAPSSISGGRALYGGHRSLFRSECAGWLLGNPGVRMPSMRRGLPPQHVVGLLVAGLLCLMAAGVATMAKYGPKRGHIYAALQQDHR